MSIKIYVKDIIICLYYHILECTLGNYSSFPRSPSPKNIIKVSPMSSSRCWRTNWRRKQALALHCQLSPPQQILISSQEAVNPLNHIVTLPTIFHPSTLGYKSEAPRNSNICRVISSVTLNCNFYWSFPYSSRLRERKRKDIYNLRFLTYKMLQP